MSNNKCCGCNGPNAICKNCICVKSKGKCLNCLPSRHGRCSNLRPALSGINSSNSQPLSSHSSTHNICYPTYSSQPNPHTSSSLDIVSHQAILDWISINKAPLVNFIPKGARNSFRSLLNSTIELINTTNSDISWIRLFCLPTYCLHAPKSDKNITTTIKERIKIFSSTSDPLSLSNVSTVSSKKSATNKSLKRCVSAKLSDGDIRAASRMISTDDSFAPFDKSTLTQLESKHPSRPSDRRDFPLGSDSANPTISSQLVNLCIRRFPKGSSGGISLLRPQHLKDALSGNFDDSSRNLLDNLSVFCNKVSSQPIPDFVRPLFFGARLVAIKKKGGGIRPIAIGDTLRRLTAKCITSLVKDHISSIVSPSQLGCGVKFGIEAAVHSCRLAIDQCCEESAMAKLDFANAFNSVRRDSVAEAVSSLAPELSTFFSLCYEKDSLLSFGDELIVSADGLQQGDPLAPILFCLVIHPALSSLKSKVKIGYLDDISLIDKSTVVLEDIVIFKSQCATIGLQLNTSKCEVSLFGSNASDFLLFESALPSIRQVHKDNIALLGSPLGILALSNQLESMLNMLLLVQQKLKSIDNHSAIFLLTHCFSLPKILFILRTSPAFIKPELLLDIDRCLRNIAMDITNVDLSDSQWIQANLPTRLGGFGINSVADTASSAFISSWLSCQQLTSSILGNSSFSEPLLDQARADWCNRSKLPDFPDLPTLQGNLTSPIHQASYDSLLTSLDVVGRNRLLGCSSPGSGDWINALPSESLGLKLSDDQCRIAIALRLGAKLSSIHTCICGSETDERGQHALTCRHLKSRHSRHQSINQLLKVSFNSASIPTRLEPHGLCRDDGKRPDGLTIPPWRKGKCLIWDATCVHRLAASWFRQSSLPGSSVAEEAEKRKKLKYEALSDDGYIFQPVAIETLGGLGPLTLQFLKELGQLIKDTTGIPESFPFLRQRLSLCIQRGNAACVMETSSHH